MTSAANDTLRISVRKLANASDRRLSGGAYISCVLLLLLFIAPGKEYLLLIVLNVFFFGTIFLIPYFRAMKTYNRIIDAIKVDAFEIEFKTVGQTSVWGLLKFRPRSFRMPASQLTIMPDRNKDIVLSFYSAIYSFSYENRKYYIVKEFFDDFKVLEAALGITK
jgi:hypothetical protein